jgi:hypothetical protein
VSIGNEPTATRQGSPVTRTGARRGLPSWARQRAVPAAPAARAVTAVLRGLEPGGWTVADRWTRPGGWTVADGWTRPGGWTVADRWTRPDGWTVADDVRDRLPDRAGPDHAVVGPAGVVVVGPGGVVVVDVRSRSGHPERRDATGRAVAGHAADAARAAAVVATLLAPRHRTAVRTLVCLTDPAPATPAVVEGVPVVGVGDLAAHLRALPARLHPADAAGLAEHLAVHLGRSRRPDVLTTAALETDARAARRRVVRPVVSGRPAAAPERHAVDHPRAHLLRADLRTDRGGGRLGALAVALRAGAVVSGAWLAWVLTAAPLGLA